MEALERKIRGVYDALEARNDKVSGCCNLPCIRLYQKSTLRLTMDAAGGRQSSKLSAAEA